MNNLYVNDKKKSGVEVSYYLDEDDMFIEQCNFSSGYDISFYSWYVEPPVTQYTVAVFRITKFK